MDKRVSLSEIIGDAWDLAKKNIWILIGFTAVQLMFWAIITAFSTVWGLSGSSVILQNLLLSLFDAFFTVAFYQVFFKLIDEPGDPEFPDFVPNLMKALNFLFVKLVIGLGLVFIIAFVSSIYFFKTDNIDTSNPFDPALIPMYLILGIPITFLTIRFCFVVCFIVDQDSGSSESLTQSWTITKGHFWLIFVLFLFMLLLNIIGAMALLIGLLFTIPFSSLVLIMAYRHLVNNYTDEEEILLDGVEEDKNGN